MNEIGNYKIPAAEVEFFQPGNTIWVHSPTGGTILRIKATGRINVSKCRDNVCSHADMIVHGNIDVCVVEKEAVVTSPPEDELV